MERLLALAHGGMDSIIIDLFRGWRVEDIHRGFLFFSHISSTSITATFYYIELCVH